MPLCGYGPRAIHNDFPVADQESISIEARNLTKEYGRLTAIRNVSFSVRQGEVLGFLGPNGAGKSTTIRILCGLLPATSGSARVCGLSVARDPAAIKNRIGYMAENNPLPEELRVVEYLKLRAALKGLNGKKRRERIDEAMELCDLTRKARRRVIGTLSKGFRQRVGIADAILGDPSVIIMDEPTIGLDPHQILAIRRLINNLRGRMTVVLSSHILTEIEACCDRVLILNQGRVVTSGTPESLRREFAPGVRYRVSFRGDMGEFERCLGMVDSAIEICGGGNARTHDGFREVTLSVPDGREIGEQLIHRLHRHAGLTLRELSRETSSLEDVFLVATRRSSQETLSPFNLKPTHLGENGHVRSSR